MRSAEQIKRTPNDWVDFRQEQRQRGLVDLLKHLRHLRETRPEWYVWVTEGQPPMTQQAYDALKKRERKRHAVENRST